MAEALSLQALERNELKFLALHRSAVWDLGWGQLFVSSDRSPKSWNFIGSLALRDVSAELAACEQFFADWKMSPSLKVTPFSDPPGLEDLLARAGWSPAVILRHMTLQNGNGATTFPFALRVCETVADIERFSEVQSAGFGVPQWVEWVHKVNVANLGRSEQRFYIAEDRSEPAGVCLMLITGDVAGLYAVTTLPAHRGRGVARALVQRCRRDALALGATTVCLNTAAGGPAESAFRRMGFTDAFDSKFFSRAGS